MTVLRLEDYAKAERLTAQIQAKITPSEYEDLLQIRKELHSRGLTNVTVSSLVRTFVLSGIRAFKAEVEADN